MHDGAWQVQGSCSILGVIAGQATPTYRTASSGGGECGNDEARLAEEGRGVKRARDDQGGGRAPSSDHGGVERSAEDAGSFEPPSGDDRELCRRLMDGLTGIVNKVSSGNVRRNILLSCYCR